MVFTDLQLALVKTLAYSDQFNFPLTPTELWQRLIKPASQQTVSKTAFVTALRNLVSQHIFIQDHELIALKGREHLFFLRQERKKYSQSKWQEVQTFLEGARSVPWIKAVAITGSLAMDNVKNSEDDVDFLIITSPRRLWLTRLVVLFRAFVKGKRRSWHGEEKNSWCFNLWLDEDHLSMPTTQRTLYGAYEVIQARWVYDTAEIEKRFLHHNEWLTDYLPQALKSRQQADSLTPPSAPPRNWVTYGMDWLEQISFQFQYAYMKPHMTREKVSQGYAFFHPRDTKALVEQQWLKTLSSLRPVAAGSKAGRPNKKPVRVLVTGVFDLLHSEHVAFLKKAKAAGDYLIVGIESDTRVKKIKGPDRPINSQKHRLAAIKKLGVADEVFILPKKFDSAEDHLALLKKVKPDILAVSENTAYQDKKSALMKQVGGVLKVVHKYNPLVSTTQILAQQATRASKAKTF